MVIILEYNLIIVTLAAAVRSGTPILFATLGEIFTERAGILNLGLEGLMLIGALSGFVSAYYTSSLLLSLIFAMLAGGIFSLIFAFLTISLKTNQVVSGLALTMLGTGISAFFGQYFIGKTAVHFNSFAIPILNEIPFLGPVLFNHDILVYISYFLAPLLWYFLFYTRPGLELRSVGENPVAADSAGINVFKIRYVYVIAGGMLTALGGAYLSLAYTSMWIENMSAGRGWIAIALVIFASWNPLKAVFGAYLFGGVSALRLRLEALGTAIPSHILMMAPYILTLLVLILSSSEKMKKKLGAPTAVGTAYSREDK